MPYPCSFIHTEEASFGIANLIRFEGKSYPGIFHIQPITRDRTVHCNGRLPNLTEGEQIIIYRMNYAPLMALEDLIEGHHQGGDRETLPPYPRPSAYETLQLCFAPGGPGTHAYYLLVGLQTTSGTHMRLRDFHFTQP